MRFSRKILTTAGRIHIAEIERMRNKVTALCCHNAQKV